MLFFFLGLVVDSFPRVCSWKWLLLVILGTLKLLPDMERNEYIQQIYCVFSVSSFISFHHILCLMIIFIFFSFSVLNLIYWNASPNDYLIQELCGVMCFWWMKLYLKLFSLSFHCRFFFFFFKISLECLFSCWRMEFDILIISTAFRLLRLLSNIMLPADFLIFYRIYQVIFSYTAPKYFLLRVSSHQKII